MSGRIIASSDRQKRTCARPECGAEFTVPYPGHRKRFCSRSCASKVNSASRNYEGSLNPKWRGGKASHPLYDIYMEMIGRCTRPTHKRYSDYGGRGITVCERWRADFWAFVADMGQRPEGLTLDRADNDKGYGPDNCRWATYSEQVNNRRPLPSRFNDQARAEMRELYESGLSTGKIAVRFDTHPTYAGIILRELGVQMRPSSPQKLNVGERNEIRALKRSGISRNELARRYKVAGSVISRIIHDPEESVA